MKDNVLYIFFISCAANTTGDEVEANDVVHVV